MKRSVVLAVVMMVVALLGCGSPDGHAGSGQPQQAIRNRPSNQVAVLTVWAETQETYLLALPRLVRRERFVQA